MAGDNDFQGRRIVTEDNVVRDANVVGDDNTGKYGMLEVCKFRLRGSAMFAKLNNATAGHNVSPQRG